MAFEGVGLLLDDRLAAINFGVGQVEALTFVRVKLYAFINDCIRPLVGRLVPEFRMGPFGSKLPHCQSILDRFFDPHLLQVVFSQTKFLHHDMLMDRRCDFEIFD